MGVNDPGSLRLGWLVGWRSWLAIGWCFEFLEVCRIWWMISLLERPAILVANSVVLFVVILRWSLERNLGHLKGQVVSWICDAVEFF